MNNPARKLKRKVTLRWFHGEDIARFEDEGVPYFSISQIARILEIPVVGDFELASNFLKFCPIVLTSVFWKNDGNNNEVFLPLPVIYAWIFSRDKNDLTEKGKAWVATIWDEVQQIIQSDPNLEKLTMELIAENQDKLLGGQE